MIPGNHDAALAESVWTRAERLGAIPQNVHLALSPEVRLFTHLGFAVLPAPLMQRHTHSDLTEWFMHAQTPPDLVRIGLAHGSVQGILAEEIDSANPISPECAHRARLDYLALGDWHGCKQIDVRTWYSGTPEQDRFKSNGAGQALLVDIRGPGSEPVVNRLATGQFAWLQWSHTLRVASDIDQFIDRIEQIVEPSVLSIRIDGEIDLAGQERLDHVLSLAEARHRSLQCDLSGLRLHPTDDDIASLRADGYLGEVISELRDRQQGEQADTAREALTILAGLLRSRQKQEEEA
jgi:DNA repair exonuclease SbcCD nuclease subunit